MEDISKFVREENKTSMKTQANMNEASIEKQPT